MPTGAGIKQKVTSRTVGQESRDPRTGERASAARAGDRGTYKELKRAARKAFQGFLAARWAGIFYKLLKTQKIEIRWEKKRSKRGGALGRFLPRRSSSVQPTTTKRRQLGDPAKKNRCAKPQVLPSQRRHDRETSPHARKGRAVIWREAWLLGSCKKRRGSERTKRTRQEGQRVSGPKCNKRREKTV